MMIPGLRALVNRIEAMPYALDMTKGGLGERLMDAASEIMERDFDHAVSPDGSAMKPLSPEYLAFKERYAHTTAIGYLEGILGESANFRGERTATPAVAWMVFGTNETAKEEAGYFNTEREFWGFSAESVERQEKILEDHVAKL